MDSLQQMLVNEVKRFARANYEMDGWDYIVECLDDEDILEAIGAANTSQDALRKVGELARLHQEREQETRNEHASLIAHDGWEDDGERERRGR